MEGSCEVIFFRISQSFQFEVYQLVKPFHIKLVGDEYISKNIFSCVCSGREQCVRSEARTHCRAKSEVAQRQ